MNSGMNKFSVKSFIAIMLVLFISIGTTARVAWADTADPDAELQEAQNQLDEARRKLTELQEEENQANAEAQSFVKREMPEGVSDKIIRAWQFVLIKTMQGLTVTQILSGPAGAVLGVKSLLTGWFLEQIRITEDDVKILEEGKKEVDGLKKVIAHHEKTEAYNQLMLKKTEQCIRANQYAVAAVDKQMKTSDIERILEELDAQIEALRKLAKKIMEAEKKTKAKSMAIEVKMEGLMASFDSIDKKADKVKGECIDIQNKLSKAGECSSRAEDYAKKAKRGFESAESVLDSCTVFKRAKDGTAMSPVSASDQLLEASIALGSSAEKKLLSPECDLEGVYANIEGMKKKIREARGEIKRVDGVLNALQTWNASGETGGFIKEAANPFMHKAGDFAQTVKDTKEVGQNAKGLFRTFKKEKTDLINKVDALRSEWPDFEKELNTRSTEIKGIGPTLAAIDGHLKWLDEYMQKGAAAKSGMYYKLIPVSARLMAAKLTLTSCDEVKTDGVAKQYLQASDALMKLDKYDADWLVKVTGKRTLCVAKLAGKKEEKVVKKPPETKTGTSDPAPPPPPQERKLVKIVAGCSPPEINEGETSKCAASGVYEDENGNRTVELVKAKWVSGLGPTIRAGYVPEGKDSFSIPVTATFGGKKASTKVVITKFDLGGLTKYVQNKKEEEEKKRQQEGGDDGTDDDDPDKKKPKDPFKSPGLETIDKEREEEEKEKDKKIQKIKEEKEKKNQEQKKPEPADPEEKKPPKKIAPQSPEEKEPAPPEKKEPGAPPTPPECPEYSHCGLLDADFYASCKGCDGYSDGGAFRITVDNVGNITGFYRTDSNLEIGRDPYKSDGGDLKGKAQSSGAMAAQFDGVWDDCSIKGTITGGGKKLQGRGTIHCTGCDGCDGDWNSRKR